MLARFALVFVIATGLLVLGHMTDKLTTIKSYLMDISTPFYSVSDMPTRIIDWLDKRATPVEELQLARNQLESESLVLKGKLQRLTALSIENVRLRELLNATPRLDEKVLLADVIAVSPSPMHHYVIIGKGTNDKVYVGQAVIDQDGLFGQVTAVATNTARVLLLTDQHHAVPVEVARNGLRGVLEGTNHFYQLNLPNIAPTSDVKEGDKLVTSGLGGLFPVGYPVAEVVKVEHKKGEPYLSITAKPYAHLNYSRHLLLLYKVGG